MFSENGRGGQQKGKKKFPMEVLFLAPVFLRHAEGKLREWNSALGYPWSTGRGSSFVATWGLCECAYLFASLTGMCRCLILSFGERRLTKEGWPDSFVLAISLSARRIFSLFCLGFVFIFSFKVVVVIIFCRSIGATKVTAYLTWIRRSRMAGRKSLSRVRGGVAVENLIPGLRSALARSCKLAQTNTLDAQQ